MSFSDCVQQAVDDPEIRADRKRAEEAQRLWKEQADTYERQGASRHQAEMMAAEDVKNHFRKRSGDELHVAVAKVTNLRKLQQTVSAASSKDFKWTPTAAVDRLDLEARALTRYFHNRLSQFLKHHHQNLVGQLKNPAQMLDVVRALKGEKVSNPVAKELADAISSVIEEARLMFNEAGGLIGKMEGFDLPHSHNASAVRKVGKEGWVKGLIEGDFLDWRKIENHMTGRPFQTGDIPPPRAQQERLLGEIWDNIVFGKESNTAVYGKTQGRALYKRRAESRQLHFRSSDKWMEYNKNFGTGDPFKTLMSHLGGMARDIAALRSFGPNPNLGMDYLNQLVKARVRKEGLDPRTGAFAAGHAERMLKLYNGPGMPQGAFQEFMASFFSTARHLMTSAFLDRAIVASISDLNSMRLAAKAAGLNGGNIMATYGKTIKDMVAEGTMATKDLLRHQWVMDTLADPGAAMARFQQEVPGAEFAERLSAMSMKVQGLSQHTDTLRFAFNAEFWGKMAGEADKAFDAIDPAFRKIMADEGITAADWEKFRTGQKYQGENGADFLNPHYWLASTDLPRAEALDIFFKFQGMIEKWQEVAVPTNSLFGKAFFDPVAYGLPPGSPMFEVMKSAGMFKSFVATFTVNQIRMIRRQPDGFSRARYIADLTAGATMMGGLALTVGELIKGNDPVDIRPWENPKFWAQAALKGGGFGIVGDIVALGDTSWGGGVASYLTGPMPQALEDVLGLTVSNVMQFAQGKDTKFAEELVRLGRRYTPMAQTPGVGPAIDRLVFDSLHRLIDPDAQEAMEKAAKRRQNRSGNESFWPFGAPLPERAPNLGAIVGR